MQSGKRYKFEPDFFFSRAAADDRIIDSEFIGLL